jgi:protocatechuate 3,4-dioxygenase beta subunit
LYTQATGEYAFTTIIPGKYLNGELYRPSHIHFRVTEKHSKELISQIYFQGDPDILADPWASEEKAQLRILQIVPEDIKGNLAITFDIYLKEKK